MASAYDLSTQIEKVIGVPIQNIGSNTTTVGGIVDTALFESLVAVIELGTLTDGDFALKLEHGDESNLSDAVDVPAEDLVGALPSLDASDTVGQVGYVGKKRFVRASIVSTNVTTGSDAAVGLIKGNPRHAA